MECCILKNHILIQQQHCWLKNVNTCRSDQTRMNAHVHAVQQLSERLKKNSSVFPGVCVCVCVCVLKCVVFERVCPSERKVILPVSVCPAAGRRSEGLLVDTCVGASHTVVGWTFLRMCVCLCDVLIHVNYIYRHHVKGKQKPTRKSRKLDRNA